MSQPIHIVTRFDGIGGTEHHAAELHRRFIAAGLAVQLWADIPTATATLFHATPINPFGGKLPRGGALLLVGTHLDLGLWLDHTRPQRLIVICNLFSLSHTFGFLAQLDRPTLPDAELVFVSGMLRDALALPGYVAPPLIDLGRFHPSVRQQKSRGAPFTVGRLSRDDPAKHHPDDASLWRLLAWENYRIRLMGASHLVDRLSDMPNVEILKAGSEDAATFLSRLDCLFYRTSAQMPEASGRVVIEALATGTPVVVSPNGGYLEWVENGTNGFIVSSQEEAFDRTVALSKSPALREEISSAARQSAEKICGESAVSAYLNWLTGQN